MTVQELRDLLTAAERISGLPWTLLGQTDIRCGDGNYLVREADFIDRPENAALIVAAINALPALLNLAEAVQDHNCPNEHWSWLDNPPHCRTRHALNQLENQ